MLYCTTQVVLVCECRSEPPCMRCSGMGPSPEDTSSALIALPADCNHRQQHRPGRQADRQTEAGHEQTAGRQAGRGLTGHHPLAAPSLPHLPYQGRG